MQVDTAGDCYIAAGGISGFKDDLPPGRSGRKGALRDEEEDEEEEEEEVDLQSGARRVFAFALDMMRCSRLVGALMGGLWLGVISLE